MISPFHSIDEAIMILKEANKDYEIVLKNPEYDKNCEPEWFKRLMLKDNLKLIEKFKKHGHKTAASFYAEIIIGATPSKGCEMCGFYYTLSVSSTKRCNLTGSCSPLKPEGMTGNW